MSIKIPKEQRALIFQGGGALGAYEVGFYQAVYERFMKLKKHKNPFDIVVGTSIGAINGGVLISYFKKNNSWEGSADYLKDFWKHLSTKAGFSDIFTDMWYSWRQFFPNAPSKEEARRLFAVNEFLRMGVPNVFSPPKIRPDSSYWGLDEPWFQSSNEGLKQSLEKFIDFPIITEYEKDEPRLLLVAVDVQEAHPVVFDSYKQKNGKHETVYGQTVSKEGKTQGGYKIEYDGIEVDHILASASVPLNYDFTKITAKQLDVKNSKDNQVTRYLWDGGILHNTPMVPLLYHHKKFWDNLIGIEKQREAIFEGDPKNETQIPGLLTFVVDMWAKKSKVLPQTRNETKSRYYEIMYSDKTDYEERIMAILDDFVTVSKNLIELSKKKGATREELEKILLPPVKTQFYTGFTRSYIDHIRGKFPMNVVRISRSEDPNDVADQAFDFSLKTIKTLFEEGYEDTKKSLQNLKKEGILN
jgi:predicted acylesterase/phospholipase RssA